MENKKLSRDELEILISQKEDKSFIGSWRYWRVQGERMIEKYYHQKNIQLLFQRILGTYKNYCLSPSPSTEENFFNAKADLKVHLFEHVWRSAFRRYWIEEGRALFTQMSLNYVQKWPLDKRQGTHLRIMGLLEGTSEVSNLEKTNNMEPIENVWYNHQAGEIEKECVGGIPFEIWIMKKEAPLRTSKITGQKINKEFQKEIPISSSKYKPKSLSEALSQNKNKN